MLVRRALALAGTIGLAAAVRAGEGPAAVAPFNDAIEAYAKLHRRVAADLPPLPKRAEAAQIAAYQKALAQRLAAARPSARQGDVFVAVSRSELRRLLREATAEQPAAKEKEIATGNPAAEGVRVPLKVNVVYPEGAPRSNVPTTVLARLPRLPPELEYRFVGDHLVLLDAGAHVIVDFMARVGEPAKEPARP